MDQAPWDRVHVFWGDERVFVPLNDPRSNARMAQEAWLDHVPIPKDQIHPLDCSQAPVAAARQYEAQLRKFFAGRPPRLDLVLLGLGDDGHTASLFAGTPALEGKGALGRRGPPGRGGPLPGYADGPPDQPGGYGGLPGGGKSPRPGSCKRCCTVLGTPGRLPAQLIQPQNGDLLWLMDLAAAARLPVGCNYLA